MVNDTYRIYRKSYRTELAKLTKFRCEHCHPYDVEITFNTVIYRFKFRDHKLSKLVKHACHALAIDDERHSFHPILWDEREEDTGRIEQVWFAGAHSNVGGGYPKPGMSQSSTPAVSQYDYAGQLYEDLADGGPPPGRLHDIGQKRRDTHGEYTDDTYALN
jgi:hypothetical protein